MTVTAAPPQVLPAPRHVAIIMDGNGRWAKRRGRPRTFGHAEGVEALRRTVEAARDLGIGYLTVYGFSTENWSRPSAEVSALFDLLRLYVRKDLERLARDGVRIRIIGLREGLDEDIAEIIERAQTRTAMNDRLHLTIAFNYGGQAEIAGACRRIAEEVAAGRLAAEAITPELVSRHLLTADLPDPDLIVRTSGEQRLSNFLLWQAAYAEFVFMDTLWPDFGKEALAEAIAQFQARKRRFGGAEA